MLLVLRDTDPHVVLAFSQVFGGHDQVSFGSGDLLAAGVDAVVSPANSFGRMDGGIVLGRAHDGARSLLLRRRRLGKPRQRPGTPLPGWVVYGLVC